MKEIYWIILLVVLLAMTIFIAIGTIIYYRVLMKYKNGLVARIHMADSTIRQYRYHVIPPDNKFTIQEQDARGNDTSFTYAIKEECIEKGTWGKYIDYDYHVMLPINPKNRSGNTFMTEMKELYKMIGALLDTDLHVKLLRNSKFEDLVKALLYVIIIMVLITGVMAGIGMFNSFKSNSASSECTLTLNNQTWQTIYVASHVSPQQGQQPQGNPR